MILFKCQECNREFKSYPSRIGIKKYCSNKCRGLNAVNLFKEGNKIGIGRKLSEETRSKLSKAFKGKTRPNVSLSKIGNKNPNWKGGVSPENKRIRMSSLFRQWRKSVFERDHYTCQICKQRGVTLHPDHIKQFAYYPEFRFDINNGRTLCASCHRKTPTWGFKKHPLPEKQI